MRSPDPEVQISEPQAGLSLLTLRDGAFHEPFYLGGAGGALVCARTMGAGEQRRGADRAWLARAGDSRRDLAARLPGWEAVATLVERGVALRAQLDAQRMQILDRTRVDFALLGQTEEEDDE